MYVYADVLFLINFIINLILLKIAAFFSKHQVSTTRCLFASSLGAFYAVCMFFPDISFLYIFPFKLLISLVMIKIICPHTKWRKIGKIAVMFYLASFCLAGILLSLVYFENISSGLAPRFKNGIFYFDVSLGNVVFAAFVCYLLIQICTSFFKRNKMLGIKKLRIILNGRVSEMSALCDTGNLLVDPLTGTPVVIAEKKRLETLFSDGLPSPGHIPKENLKIRIIPYSSLGKKDGVLTGFVPDEVCIDGKKTGNVIVAIAPGTLSEKDEYNALFNPEILN